MSFFKVTKVIAYDILLIVEQLILILAANRQMYYEPLCVFSHNSLHYHQCYRETKSDKKVPVHQGLMLRQHWKSI